MKKIIIALMLTMSISNAQDKPAITALDVGVLGLSAHDLFDWDNHTKTNRENGKFDLSTIFDYKNGTVIDKGGNPKNSQNALVYSITQNLVSEYKGAKAKYLETMTEEEAHLQARKDTVKIFLELVKASYTRMIGRFPTIGLPGEVTTSEQAAMRALHDILPAEIKVDDGTLKVTDYKTAMTLLSFETLLQPIPYYDGKYDPAYLAIPMPPGMPGPGVVNLMEEDQKFIIENTNLSLNKLLSDIKFYASISSPESDFANSTLVGYYIRSLYSKGLCKVNQDGSTNAWMPQNISCGEAENLSPELLGSWVSTGQQNWSFEGDTKLLQATSNDNSDFSVFTFSKQGATIDLEISYPNSEYCGFFTCGILEMGALEVSTDGRVVRAEEYRNPWVGNVARTFTPVSGMLIHETVYTSEGGKRLKVTIPMRKK